MGVLTYFFGRKLHENERIWTPGGGASLAPPLRSATGKHINLLHTRLSLYMNNHSDEILFHYKVLVINNQGVIVYKKTFSFKRGNRSDQIRNSIRIRQFPEPRVYYMIFNEAFQERDCKCREHLPLKKLDLRRQF